MNVDPSVVSQAEFARQMGVSRAAVSQWKSSGILGDEAFTQPGRKGKLHLAIAAEHVRKNRDIGQSLGNGIATRTSAVPEVPETGGQEEPVLPLAPRGGAEPLAPRKVKSVEDQLKEERLVEQMRRNRMQAAEEALQKGQLVSADEAREEMGRVAKTMLQIFEGALPDFAADLAAAFSIPQRDALHVLRARYVKVRKAAAEKEAQRQGVMDTDSSIEFDV